MELFPTTTSRLPARSRRRARLGGAWLEASIEYSTTKSDLFDLALSLRAADGPVNQPALTERYTELSLDPAHPRYAGTVLTGSEIVRIANALAAGEQRATGRPDRGGPERKPRRGTPTRKQVAGAFALLALMIPGIALVPAVARADGGWRGRRCRRRRRDHADRADPHDSDHTPSSPASADDDRGRHDGPDGDRAAADHDRVDDDHDGADHDRARTGPGAQAEAQAGRRLERVREHGYRLEHDQQAAVEEARSEEEGQAFERAAGGGEEEVFRQRICAVGAGRRCRARRADALAPGPPSGPDAPEHAAASSGSPRTSPRRPPAHMWTGL